MRTEERERLVALCTRVKAGKVGEFSDEELFLLAEVEGPHLASAALDWMERVYKPVTLELGRRYNRNLTFQRFSEMNRVRCEEVFHPLSSWSLTDWTNACAGEVGELCNFAKKLRRGEDIPEEKLGKEIADAVTYLDLTAQRMGFRLVDLLVDKFNMVSDKYGSAVKLPEQAP